MAARATAVLAEPGPLFLADLAVAGVCVVCARVLLCGGAHPGSRAHAGSSCLTEHPDHRRRVAPEGAGASPHRTCPSRLAPSSTAPRSSMSTATSRRSRRFSRSHPGEPFDRRTPLERRTGAPPDPPAARIQPVPTGQTCHHGRNDLRIAAAPAEPRDFLYPPRFTDVTCPLADPAGVPK